MSPFVSKSQRRWAYANNMKWAKEWDDETEGNLPNKVNGGNIEDRIKRHDALKKKKKK